MRKILKQLVSIRFGWYKKIWSILISTSLSAIIWFWDAYRAIVDQNWIDDMMYARFTSGMAWIGLLLKVLVFVIFFENLKKWVNYGHPNAINFIVTVVVISIHSAWMTVCLYFLAVYSKGWLLLFVWLMPDIFQNKIQKEKFLKK